MKIKPSALAAAVAAAGLAAVGLSVPAAQAAGPATAVTATTLKQYDFYDDGPRSSNINMRAISGTASGLTATTVDIVCLNLNTGKIDTTLERSIAVTNGKWSTAIDTSDLSGYRCRIAALENGASPDGEDNAARLNWGKAFKSFSPFNQVLETYVNFEYLGGNPGNAITWGGYLYTATPNSLVGSYGPDDSSLYRFYPIGPDGTYYNSKAVFGGWYGSGYSAKTPMSVSHNSSNEAGILVDNAQAFTNYSIDRRDANYTAKSSNKSSLKVDPKTGVITMSETMQLFKCTTASAGSVYSYASNCPDYKTTKLGVTWTHTKTVNAAGNTVKVVNTFASVDKKAHTVRFTQQDTLKGNGYRWGTSGAFTDISTEDKTNVTGYGAKWDVNSATAIDNHIGQVVFGAKATTWASTDYYYGAYMYARWSGSIKAGKSTSFNSGYTLVIDDTKAAAQIGNALK